MNRDKVLILMGSPSDQGTMSAALPYYEYFGITTEVIVSSAHRNPDRTAKLAADARANGYCAIVCGAGMAAHLAGVCAAHSDLPILGVPLPGGIQDGMDALLSTVQMPKGVPVATFAVGKAGAINCAVFIARFLSMTNSDIHDRLKKFQAAGCKIPD